MRKISVNYDVIVTGAGYSGAACAFLLADKGLQVALLESTPREHLGQKSARLMLDVDTFSKTGLPRPQGDELLSLLDTFYAYSPSGRVRKSIDFSALLLDGFRFQQRLLALAEAAGVQFIPAHVERPLLDTGRVIGVETNQGQFQAPLVIDASGNAQVLVRALVEQGFLHALKPEHLEAESGLAYRLSAETGLPAAELHIHFCLKGGYIWRSAFDIGLGMMSETAVDLIAIREQVEALRLTFDWPVEQVLREDIGRIPIRYPLLNLVGPGFAVLGDAGYMVNSVRGGGVSAGLKGARILADVAHDALQSESVGEPLWCYNQRYQREIGAQLAYQDVMRQTLMNEPPEQMEFAFEKDLITADDIRNSLAGRLLDFTPFQKLQKGLRGATHPALLLRLNNKLDWGKHIYEHFRKFPEQAAEFADWQSDLLHFQARLHL